MISAILSFVRVFVTGALTEVADESILAQLPIVKSNNNVEATRSDLMAGRLIVTLASHFIMSIWVSLLRCDFDSEMIEVQTQFVGLQFVVSVASNPWDT
jgi:hypothetical protein